MIKRTLAAAGLLSVVLSVPLVLLGFAGAPGIDRLPDLNGIRRAIELRWVPAEWAMQVLALFAWGLWAYLLVALLLRVAGSLQARHGTEGTLWAASEAVTWGPVKLLVDVALGAILVNSAASQSPARAGELGWARAIAPQVAVVREHEAPSAERTEQLTARARIGATPKRTRVTRAVPPVMPEGRMELTLCASETPCGASPSRSSRIRTAGERYGGSITTETCPTASGCCVQGS